MLHEKLYITENFVIYITIIRDYLELYLYSSVYNILFFFFFLVFQNFYLSASIQSQYYFFYNLFILATLYLQYSLKWRERKRERERERERERVKLQNGSFAL